MIKLLEDVTGSYFFSCLRVYEELCFLHRFLAITCNSKVGFFVSEGVFGSIY